MKNDYSIIISFMIKDNILDQAILAFESENKRDMTIEEENKIVSDMVEECRKRMLELRCSIVEAYKDINY